MDKLKLTPCIVRLEQLPVTPKAQLGLSAELRNVINERNILTARTKKRYIHALNELNESPGRKNQAFQEILDTELAYVNQLETLMQFFIEPLKELNLVDNCQFHTVFGNIETIYKVHRELVSELKKNIANLAQAFLRLAPFFKLYSVYAYNYKEAMKILQRLYQKNGSYAKFLDNQESRPEVQTKLASLLICPIQRIPRYCLLLQQVLDHTSKTDSDYSGIVESLKHVKTAAKHINKLVEEQEHSQRLIELQNSLDKSLETIIKPGRKLLKEGYLKQAEKDSKSTKRYVLLFTDVLLVCKIIKKDLTCSNSLKCLNNLPLHKCKLTHDRMTKMFEVCCQGDRLTLFDESGSLTDEWIDCLNDAVEDVITNRKTLRKEYPSQRLNSKRKSTDDNVEKGGKSTLMLWKRKKVELTSDTFKLTKRKPIHTPSETSGNGGSLNCLQQDCLFPLRQHLSLSDSSGSVDSQQNEVTSSVTNRMEVYRFGEGDNLNESFTVGGVFNGIGKTIKRFFGLKQ